MTSTSIDMLVVTATGEVRDHAVTAGDTRLVTASSVLQALYEQIGCAAVDVVRLTSEIDMWVDDEGLLRTRPSINQLASYIATRFGYAFSSTSALSCSPGRPGGLHVAAQSGGPADAARPRRRVA